MTRGATILVVDDESSGRETIEALLFAEPYELRFADSGRAALRALAREPIDAVICDIMMPGIDGFEVCRRIRADERWALLPVMLCTALDGDDDVAQGLGAGANDFVSKPVSGVVLRARLRAMLRVRSNYEEVRSGRYDLDALMRQRRESIMRDAGLTPRETEVLGLLLLGRTYDDIGRALGLKPRTAKFHQARILKKLGAESRLDLSRIFL